MLEMQFSVTQYTDITEEFFTFKVSYIFMVYVLL